MLGLLEADPAVAGVTMVGSLGRGEEDNWSDFDLLMLASGQVKAGALSSGEFNASGPRQPVTAKTADEVRQIHLGYVPIAGKYVARRSSRACEMIRFLGHRRELNDRDPAAQLAALRGIAKTLSSASSGRLADAVAAYLDLVETPCSSQKLRKFPAQPGGGLLMVSFP